MNRVEDIILEPPPEEVVADPMSWFASPGPFELEIGCGKGGFLLNRARSAPQVRLLGIEWANKFFQYAADRMVRWNLTNVRVMRADAKPFVMRQLPSRCLSVLHLYHPDPWPKKRHHKRRLVQTDFAEAVVRLLIPGGRWLIQSDHAEYFDQMREVAGGRAELTERPWEELTVDAGADWGGTNYEIKYSREGRRIYHAAFAKFDANAVPAV